MKTTKIRNIFGNRYRGTIGKDLVASSWKGKEYIREYQTPTNANTVMQQQHRALFTRATKTWGTLSSRQKEFYEKIADGMSGYNLFVGRFIAQVRAGFDPEIPIVLEWTTADGQPVPGGYLIVRHGGRQLFGDHLDDAKGAVALTPSDAPYAFVLARGTQEETVLTVEDLLEADIPFDLESKTLGIKLVATVPTPPIEPGPTPR